MPKEMPLNILPSTPEETIFLKNKLGSFNHKALGLNTQNTPPTSQNYSIKEGEEVIAGIASYIYWDILQVDTLFVDEHYRGKRLGSALLKKVEDEARILGASLVHLDTFDFQAKDFYIKQGYEVFGVLEDCPKDHKRYYLKKSLIA